jgi:threonine aldolase
MKSYFTIVGDLPWLQKRSGQLASKQRYIAAQMLAMLEDDLWQENATHANNMAQLLREKLTEFGIKPLFKIESNALFVKFPNHLAHKLFEYGHYFYDWSLFGDDVYRLITSWSTTAQEIESFCADIVL